MSGSTHIHGEELQDLLDERLADPRRAEVHSHVQACTRCRRELDALRFASERARAIATDLPVPPELMQRVRRALDAEDARLRPVRMTRRRWIVTGLAAAAAVVVIVRVRRAPQVPSLVADNFRAYVSRGMPLEIISAEPAAIAAYFVQRGIAFETRVFDLAMMQYQLTGGRANDLGGRRSALFAYRGRDGTALVCQMYQGRVTDLPAAAATRVNNGISFFVHTSAELTLVFWQEGDVVCVLASDAPAETVIQLAFAKAMKVAVRT